MTRRERPRIVLAVHKVDQTGGMERVCAELIRRASERFRFTVIASYVEPEISELVEWRRIPVPRKPAPALFLTYYALAGRTLGREPADLRHAVGALVPNRVDLSTVHFCHSGYLGTTGRKTPPNTSLMRRANTSVHRTISVAAERWTYGKGRARVLAGVSEGIARELRAIYPDADVRVTPNGVDSGKFRPDAQARQRIREALGISHRSYVALFVGGDWARKGLDVAIRAIAALPRELDPRLIVVGKGDRRRHTAVAAAARVEDRVHFVGPSTTPEDYYAAADVFVLPTIYEAAPLVVLEAAASGLPIVATRVNGVEEFLERGAGVSVERTVSSVGAALAKLARNPRERTTLAKRGRARAHELSWEASAQSTCKIYEELLDAKRLGHRP
jgi:glycosyltransferase involved in cell wall biosynthesis